MGRFPSGQREQTVNLPLLASVVRIHPCPPSSAGMAELADAHDSGSCVRTYLQVQVLFPALRALDFQGLCPFVPLPYRYRTATGFLAPAWEPFFRFGYQINLAKFWLNSGRFLAVELPGKQIPGMFPITKDCVQKKTFRISGRFGKAFHRLHAHTVDQFLHPFRAGFTHFVNNVAVFIQRESCGIVPHVLLQGLDIIAGFNAVYSECMTKIMDPVML